MRNLLLAATVLSVAGFALATTAYALETPDQAAAEGFVQPASPPQATQTPANPDNGLAQRRTEQPQQQDILPQSVPPQQ